MQYTKAMIDLIQEARRRAPSKKKPDIKLANPNIFNELIQLYDQSKDHIFKTLVKEIINLAGDPWLEKLHIGSIENTIEKPSNYWVKVYRGQTQLIKKKDSEKLNHIYPSLEKDSSKLVYRGQKVRN